MIRVLKEGDALLHRPATLSEMVIHRGVIRFVYGVSEMFVKCKQADRLVLPT